MTRSQRSWESSVLGKMPIDPVLADLADKGEFERACNPALDGAFPVFQELAKKGSHSEDL